MGLKLANSAGGLLAAGVSDSATALTLQAGHGSRFPTISAPDDFFPITVVRAKNPSQYENMLVTGRAGDTLTVQRAQEGTARLSFSPGDIVELRLTAGTLEENFPQVEGRNAKNLRFSIDSVGGKPELKFKSGDDEETVVRQSDIEDVVRQSDIEDVVRGSDLGTAATRDVTTSPTDTTAGRVLTVGSLGLGGAAADVPGNNIDDNTIPTGFYYVITETSGTKPPGDDGYGHLIVSREGHGVTARQLYLDNDSDRIWTRVWNQSQWSTWQEVYHSGNLIKAFGGANQSLSSNGYQKLPGGLIIQWGVANLGPNLASRDAASVIGAITFPIAFPTMPFSASVAGFVPGSTGGEAVENFLSVEAISSSNLIVTATRVTGSGGANEILSVAWIAIGH